MTKEEIEIEFNFLALHWEYERNDDCYVHYSLTEYKGIWFSKKECINEIWVEYINSNNEDRNTVPFIIETIEEFKLLLKFMDL